MKKKIQGRYYYVDIYMREIIRMCMTSFYFKTKFMNYTYFFSVCSDVCNLCIIIIRTSIRSRKMKIHKTLC